MPDYYVILTSAGQAAFALADSGGDPVDIADFAVGDGGGGYNDPDENQVSLVNETWRGAINRIYVHPTNANWVVVEALIPMDQGGWDIREAGLFDDGGTLLAVAKYPLTTKPAVGSGSEKDLYVRMVLAVSNGGDVIQQITADQVMATQQYVDDHAGRQDNPHQITVAQIGAETPAGAQAKVDAHEAAADPHPQYETEAEAQAKVDAHADRQDNPHQVNAAQAGADPAGTAAAAVGTHEGAADPHPQYETDAEVQAKVAAAVAALVDASPAALNTLNELAAAMGDDPNFAASVFTALATKAAKAGSASQEFSVASATAYSHAVRLNQFAAALANPLVLRIPTYYGGIKVTVYIQAGLVPDNVATIDITLPVTVNMGLFCGAFYGGDVQGDPDSAPSAWFLDNSTIRVRPNKRGASEAAWITIGY